MRASGRFSKAICDSCGFKMDYSEMVRDGARPNLWVHNRPECRDGPEWKPGNPKPVKTTIAHPRPDVRFAAPSPTVESQFPPADDMSDDNWEYIE